MQNDSQMKAFISFNDQDRDPAHLRAVVSLVGKLLNQLGDALSILCANASWSQTVTLGYRKIIEGILLLFGVRWHDTAF